MTVATARTRSVMDNSFAHPATAAPQFVNRDVVWVANSFFRSPVRTGVL